MSLSTPANETGTVLSQLKPGESGRIGALELQGTDRARLLEMGMTVGATVTVLRYAPLGDPLEVRVRGYCLSLRKSEAEHIKILRKP